MVKWRPLRFIGIVSQGFLSPILRPTLSGGSQQRLFWPSPGAILIEYSGTTTKLSGTHCLNE